MRWQDLNTQDCPIARSLALLGDRWTLLILRDCFFGLRRFEAFQSSLGLSRTLLQVRLSNLVEAGLLAKTPYQTNPPRYEYRLSEKGRALQGVLLMLGDWGNQTLLDGRGVEYVHKTCGEPFRPQLICSSCGDHVGARDVVTIPIGRDQGPGSPGSARA